MRVEPLRGIDQVRAVAAVAALYGPRDKALFLVGVNTNLRASDLCGLNVGQVRSLREGDTLTITEKKTKKTRQVHFNTAAVDAIQDYLATRPHAADDDPLFLSRKINTKAGGRLYYQQVWCLVKKWTAKAGLNGNFGGHSPRKTWGFMANDMGVMTMGELMKAFNHSREVQTLDYLCITEDRIRKAVCRMNLA